MLRKIFKFNRKEKDTQILLKQTNKHPTKKQKLKTKKNPKKTYTCFWNLMFLVTTV